MDFHHKYDVSLCFHFFFSNFVSDLFVFYFLSTKFCPFSQQCFFPFPFVPPCWEVNPVTYISCASIPPHLTKLRLLQVPKLDFSKLLSVNLIPLLKLADNCSSVFSGVDLSQSAQSFWIKYSGYWASLMSHYKFSSDTCFHLYHSFHARNTVLILILFL